MYVCRFLLSNQHQILHCFITIFFNFKASIFIINVSCFTFLQLLTQRSSYSLRPFIFIAEYIGELEHTHQQMHIILTTVVYQHKLHFFYYVSLCILLSVINPKTISARYDLSKSWNQSIAFVAFLNKWGRRPHAAGSRVCMTVFYLKFLQARYHIEGCISEGL